MEQLDAAERRLHALMLKAQAGDESAYRSLLIELSERLRVFYRQRLKNITEETEDLVQETLLAIHNQRDTYDDARPLTVWMYAIARYKLIDLLRRRGRREMLTDALDDVSEVAAAQDSSASEARRDLMRLVEALPERQRAAIRHVKMDGRSVADTAQLTGMSVSAVKVNIHRGLKALAKSVRDSL